MGANETSALAGVKRRLLTILFYDMVGSTALANAMGVEDLLQVLRALHRAVTRAMERHGGFAARYLGDGGVVYFGWPSARGDDPERAVAAALDALQAVAALDLPARRRLQLRIGIATGNVLVGDVVGTGTGLGLDVVGVTPNVAARLETQAPVDGILVDDATRQRAGARFDWRGPDWIATKAAGTPLRAWRVGAPWPSNAPRRREAAAACS